MFSVYHRDKFSQYLLQIFDTRDEAERFVKRQYAGRFMPGRDYVYICDEQGVQVNGWEVDYMAQFEAVKTWSFGSRSSGKTWTTQLNSRPAGLLSCNCPGWTFKKKDKARWCKHTTAVAQQEGYQLQEVGQYLYIVDQRVLAAKQKYAGIATTPQQKFMALIAEYEDAIARMSQLDPGDMLRLAPEVETCKFKVESYMLLLEQHGINGMEAYESAQAKLGKVLS
jgi:hypothetical protein